MNREEEPITGSHLGHEAVEYLAQRAEDYSDYERQRIALVNEARINALNMKGAHLTEQARQLQERLRRTQPAENNENRRHQQPYYWTAAGILIVSAFLFSLIGFAPYRLGWVGDLYCLGIAVVTPFAVEEFLQAWRSERVFKCAVTSVFISAIIGGALLATIRGDLLSEQMQPADAAVVIDSASAPGPRPNSFYQSTGPSLRMLMLFLALAIDLGAGVAVHRALAAGKRSGGDYEALSRELAAVQHEVAAVVYEMTALKNAPAIFVARFWRDFYRATLTQVARKAVGKWLGLCVCLLLFGAAGAFARTSLVVAVDLSTSVALKGRDGETQLDKNIKGVERLLGSIEPDSRVTVVGVTQNSFADPLTILRAEVSPDRGYFGERLTTARRELVLAWRERALHLAATAHGTDIFGALCLARELFQIGPQKAHRILVIYSDMRHVTREVDLETLRRVPVDSFYQIQNRHLLADLRGITVYVLGANAGGRRIADWEKLKQFWLSYFERSGATLAGYSMTLDPPQLGH